MNIKVHRGLEQIGGCITEISTETSRVFIDMGQNLPGNGEVTTPEQDRKMVEGLFANNQKEHEAVFYTHGHEDHVGLFEYVPLHVPQYMSAGTKELLLLKYGILKERQELNLEQIRKNGCTPEALEEANTKIINVDNKKNRLLEMKTWSRALPGESPKSISIGDITITPFFNCHSIYDSYMFLIEAEGKRVWHTGDYRLHGYLGKGLFPTLQKYATNIDTLITEGTMLNRNDDCIHEYEVAERMASVMKAYKYVFVLASATDIERLASIKNASEKTKKRMYVCSKFMISTMRFFTEYESELSHGLFCFAPRMYGRMYLGRMKKKGFVLVSGTSHISRVAEVLKELPADETILIYSSWEGYYTIPEQVEANPDYKNFRELFSNVVDIHTSGHADKSTIQKVIEIVKPKEVICIHKEPGVVLEFSK